MKKFPCEKRAGSQRWKLRWSNKDGEREPQASQGSGDLFSL